MPLPHVQKMTCQVQRGIWKPRFLKTISVWTWERWWILSSGNEREWCDYQHVTSVGQRKNAEYPTRFKPMTFRTPWERSVHWVSWKVTPYTRPNFLHVSYKLLRSAFPEGIVWNFERRWILSSENECERCVNQHVDELTDICQQPVWDENRIKTSITIFKRTAPWTN